MVTSTATWPSSRDDDLSQIGLQHDQIGQLTGLDRPFDSFLERRVGTVVGVGANRLLQSDPLLRPNLVTLFTAAGDHCLDADHSPGRIDRRVGAGRGDDASLEERAHGVGITNSVHARGSGRRRS